MSALFALHPSIVTFADEGALVSVDVADAALELTVPANTSIELNPVFSGAVFGNTDITVRVATNSINGYTLLMSVPTTDLTHSTITGDNAPVIPTLKAAASQANFPANAWGYKVVGDDYLPVLNSNTPVSWSSNEPTNGTNYVMTLGAKVDGTKTSGAYVNTLTFQVVANPNSHRDTIIFDKNNENATGSMNNQTIYQASSTVLNNNQFSLEGMRFAGWSTTASGTGTGVRYYADGALYYAEEAGENRQITLYAQWTNLPDTTDDPGGDGGSGGGAYGTTLQRAYEIAYTAAGKGMYIPEGNGYREATSGSDYDGIPANDCRFLIQDMTPEICASATAIGTDAFVLDIRDNKSYWIAKANDGHCWMTQNLDLDLAHDKVLTHANTDLGWTNWNTNATWNPNTTANTTDVSNWVRDYNIPYSVEGGEVYVLSSGSNTWNVYDTTFTDLQDCPFEDKRQCKHYHLGNYYNWPAAIATNNGNGFNGIAPNSICPAGWRLTGPSDYGNLFVAHNIMASASDYVTTENGFIMMRDDPLYFIRNGEIDSTNKVLRYIGHEGYYWLNEGGAPSSAGLMSFGGTASIYPHQIIRYRRGNGYAIRCLARD